MKKGILLFFIGFVLLMAGIFVSTLLSTGWIISGTLIAIIGGGLMGMSSYFFVSRGRSIHN
ncbi:hypothetical protein DVB69_15420 [Sporosarcina sp. BI001-red]|uniref:hypothetical protein n=1 Tax=Sporosarcina sp. BI001-red TaxID=2282866 RepID=UPI000E240CFF|nr:hypothetical protein [Sporosarcina sp. BI001-red]REB05153.1 hypothetical protein DVB69_15420 [Sporosarcina sp. BI001-red]